MVGEEILEQKSDQVIRIASLTQLEIYLNVLGELRYLQTLTPAAGVAFMLDQCHNIEPKIPAQIRSVMNVQEATAKALLIDTDELARAQQDGDVLAANAVMMDAYNTDVRPLLAEVRKEAGLDPDPVAAYRGSGYGEKIVAERIGGQQAGWGA